jgi:F420-dependent oxidoreductase-like protein
VWEGIDRDGFWDAVWLNDHLYPPRSDASLPIFDPYPLLAGCAAVTERVRFGVMVTANTFRHPAVLAKMAVTIDEMSGGRLELGIGAGWLESEHRAFDIPLPSLTERFDRLEETFAILDGLFTQERFTHEGRFYTIRDAVFEPKPVQKPRIPFVVGGDGPRRTMPLAARWADQWNFPDFGEGVVRFRERHELLQELCDDIGRDASEIEVSVQIRYPNDLAKAVDQALEYVEAGADHILVTFMPPSDTALPAQLGEALRAATS